MDGINLANTRSHQEDPLVPCSCNDVHTHYVQPGPSHEQLVGHEKPIEMKGKQSVQQLPPIPDGGLVAWLQVLGSFSLFFNSWGILNAFGVFQSYYNSDGGILPNETSSSLSWIGSTQACLLLVCGVVSGPLYDAGYFRQLIITGSFLVVFGMMMTSIAHKYWEIVLAQGVVVGLGSGLIFIPGVAILPQYFTTKRIIATGIATSGSSVAGVIYPIVFHRLQPRIGFPWATRVLGFLMLAGLLVSIGGMKVRVQPHEKRSFFDKTALKEKPYVIFTSATFFLFAGAYIPFFYMALYASYVGIDKDLSFYTIAMLNAASTFGRVLPNYIADKTGPLNVLTPAAFITATVGFAWIAANNVGGVAAISLLYGFFSGALVSLPPPTIVHLSPRLDVVGTRLGMTFFVAGLGLLVGNPVAGAILGDSKDPSFLGVQLFCACCVMAAGVLLLVARIAKTGMKLSVKT